VARYTRRSQIHTVCPLVRRHTTPSIVNRMTLGGVPHPGSLDQSMSKKYEFGHQSTRQKVILIGVKFFVLLLLAESIYSLGWHTESLQERISATGRLLIYFWLYTNLMRAKIEIQELFVPPIVQKNGVEFLLFGAIFSTIDMFWTIWNIIQLS